MVSPIERQINFVLRGNIHNYKSFRGGYKMFFDERSIQLAQLFNSHDIQWAYGGSSLLYYLGISVIPRDLDVVIASCDIERAKKVLESSNAKLLEEKMSNDDYLTEKFYTFSWGNIEIDLMAQPGIKKDAERFILDFDHKGPWKFIIKDEISIALCSPEDWLKYYSLMSNRQKRVEQLTQYLAE